MSEKTFMNGVPAGVVFCNLKSSNKRLPDAAGLPTLVRTEAMNALMKGDANEKPLFVCEAVDFPVAGTGGVYTKEFFQSYLKRMETHPFGGNKLGHAYPEKNDFYTVGGKLESNDNESGTVYFKIYVPSEGYETTNNGFIRDLEAKNVHFSLVTLPEYIMKRNPVTKEDIRYFTASAGMERNDAVPYEGGAMPQTVNSKEFDYEQVKSLIESGQVDYTSRGETLIQNGLVTYSALRRLAANAGSRTPELVELVSFADKKRNRSKRMDEDKVINKDEALKTLKGLYANGQISMADIADALGSTAPKFIKGAEDQIRNEQDRKNAEVVKNMGERLGDNPVEEVDKLLNSRKEVEKLLMENKIREKVGDRKIKNSKGEEIDNPAYLYAFTVCNGKSGKALDDALEALKDDQVMQNIRGSQADMNSGFNRVEKGQGAAENSGAPATMEV